jgi:hypothetical protein
MINTCKYCIPVISQSTIFLLLCWSKVCQSIEEHVLDTNAGKQLSQAAIDA